MSFHSCLGVVAAPVSWHWFVAIHVVMWWVGGTSLAEGVGMGVVGLVGDGVGVVGGGFVVWRGCPWVLLW